VKVNVPKKPPTVFRIIKGSLVVSHDSIGVVIPIWSPNTTSKVDKLDIRSGDYLCKDRLVPHTIILLNVESFDVHIELSADVPFLVIIHPKSPKTTSGESAA
jgi:hypothetical protein